MCTFSVEEKRRHQQVQDAKSQSRNNAIVRAEAALGRKLNSAELAIASQLFEDGFKAGQNDIKYYSY